MKMLLLQKSQSKAGTMCAMWPAMKAFQILAIAAISLSFFSCDPPVSVTETEYVYRQDMRQFVKNISQAAKATNPSFLIVPQNGQAVALQSYCSDCATSVDADYMNAINGVGREDLNYGYSADNKLNSASQNRELSNFLNLYTEAGKTILVTDYVWSQSGVDDSYATNTSLGYVGYAAPSRELDQIPKYPVQPYQENTDNVTSLASAKNFLYLINPADFASKSAFLQQVGATNYDVLIIDAFYEDEQLSKNEVASLKVKANGGKRLVLAYMSIGEAEDYRYYWNTDWEANAPEWLVEENSEWEGNFKVKYWNSDWQGIIYSNSDSYLNKLLSSGFDGAYLDIIDAYEYFEE